MKHILLALVLLTGHMALAENIKISSVDDWTVYPVTKKTPISEAMGNPIAIITRPAQTDGFIPTIAVFKVPLNLKFNDLNVLDWREVTLKDRTEPMIRDKERLLGIATPQKRYLAQIRFDQKAEIMTHAFYMSMRMGSDLYYFKFIEDRELYYPYLSSVQKFMTKVTISTATGT